MGEVAKIEEHLPEVQADPTALLLQTAVEKGADAGQLTQLVELQERMIATQARKDFNQAMHEFQSLVSVVPFNKKSNRNRYASKDQIAEYVKPHLQRCGLSYRFDCELADGYVTTICTVSHLSGHEENTTFKAPIDSKMSANDTQKVASANSYGQRYALLMAFGLSTGEVDDDGQAAGTVMITNEQVMNLEALSEEVGADNPNFLKYLKVDRIQDLPASKYQQAIKALEAKRK